MITRYKQLKHWIGITAYLFPLFNIIAPSGFMASGQKLEEASEEFLRVFIWIGIENNNNNNSRNLVNNNSKNTSAKLQIKITLKKICFKVTLKRCKI